TVSRTAAPSSNNRRRRGRGRKLGGTRGRASLVAKTPLGMSWSSSGSSGATWALKSSSAASSRQRSGIPLLSVANHPHRVRRCSRHPREFGHVTKEVSALLAKTFEIHVRGSVPPEAYE